MGNDTSTSTQERQNTFHRYGQKGGDLAINLGENGVVANGRLFLLTLHIAFVNSGEVLGVCTRRDGFDWSFDSSIASWHRLPPLLAKFVEIMSQESVSSHGSPEGCPSKRAYNAGHQEHWINLISSIKVDKMYHVPTKIER